jgi:hypothetical protein
MKRLSLMVVFSLSMMSSFAQVSVGFKGGANLSKVSKFMLIENISPDFKFAPAAGGGVFVNVGLHKNVSLQTEFNFVQKGFKIKEGISLEEFTNIDIPLNASAKLKMQYFQVPILLKIKNNNGIYLAAGPSFGYLSNTDVRINLFGLLPLQTNFPKQVFKATEMGIIGALGAEQKISSRVSFLSEVRYEAGVSRLLNTPVVQLPVRSQNISGNVGLQIKI